MSDYRFAPKPWVFVRGDVDWKKYGGVWARQTGPGVYEFMEWFPSDSGRGGEARGTNISLRDMRREIPSALKTIGLSLRRGRLVADDGTVVPPLGQPLAIAEALYATWGNSWSGAHIVSRPPGQSAIRAFGESLYKKLNQAHTRAFNLPRRQRR